MAISFHIKVDISNRIIFEDALVCHEVQHPHCVTCTPFIFVHTDPKAKRMLSRLQIRIKDHGMWIMQSHAEAMK